jgi:sigma-B regulation protein RsbU (phosphoserine phosphatase)
VGLLPTATYEEHRLQLAPGDRLYFCTDGVFEAENAAEQEFGVERFLQLLAAHREGNLGDSLTAVMTAVESYAAPAGLADDASLLAIERL